MILPRSTSHRRNKLQLTDKDVAISRIKSKLLEPLSVNVEKGSDRPPTDMKAGREGPVSGREEVTGRAVTYLSKEKLLSGLCHDRTSLALMRLRVW